VELDGGRRLRLAAVALAALLLSGCAARQQPPAAPATSVPAADSWPRLALAPLVSGLDAPLDLVPAPDGRLLVVEQAGLVLAWRDGALDADPFLDVRNLTLSGGERGLLGLAFDGRGRAYVSYTDLGGSSVLARYRLLADGDADPASAETLLRVQQPFPNHKGGDVAFGPDGDLYYGLGDGGSEGDPQGNGQNPRTLLASMLRLDVSGERGYAIPATNPWAHGGAGPPEVWAKGLRNPWRFSFDRATGDLYVADVGQDKWEEIDYVPRGSATSLPLNFGWNAFEGDHVYDPLTRPFSAVTAPVAEYSHAEGGCAVIGGFVYRGAALPGLRGTYLFGDECSGKVWGLRHEAGGWNRTLLMTTGLQISSFGQDASGELYVVDLRGSVQRIVGAS
jgi:glucose/arabinose dehydrogenase